MHKRINGKMYDTEKAKLVGHYDNGYPVNDNRYTEFWIYKKRTGEYFLYGESNAGGDFAEFNPSAGAYESGYGFRPLSLIDAKHLIEKQQDKFDNSDVDVYEQEFGKLNTATDVKITKTYSLKKTNAEKLERLAQEQGVSRSEMLDRLIENE
ncbi:MAG: hypothetical protein HDR41_00225 [Lactobacillus sp.]|nr:hypothetical protein [Lactobacillus sp.]